MLQIISESSVTIVVTRRRNVLWKLIYIDNKLKSGYSPYKVYMTNDELIDHHGFPQNVDMFFTKNYTLKIGTDLFNKFYTGAKKANEACKAIERANKIGFDLGQKFAKEVKSCPNYRNQDIGFDSHTLLKLIVEAFKNGYIDGVYE